MSYLSKRFLGRWMFSYKQVEPAQVTRQSASMGKATTNRSLSGLPPSEVNGVAGPYTHLT
jgi:hypothetical protein